MDKSLPRKEEDLIPAVIKIIPGFQKRWDKHLKRWKGEPAGIYNDIAQVAHFVVDSYDKGDTSWYPAFFNFIESLIVEGDKEIRELATIGFLEDIQTISSWRPHKGEVFIDWLGPKSKEAWQELDKLWSNYGSLANILRAGY